ncbi:MAG: heavy-metal-associated domain-containing protein [Bacteroidetes bacterium]|nr:heavy-metal-associated domain-containing protein [Bacteroidota bacterium]
METIRCILFTVLFAGIICHASGQEKAVDTIRIRASMKCNSCKAKIEKNIAFEKGVKHINADVATKVITIAYRRDKNNPESLVKAIQKLGYEAEPVEGQSDSNLKLESPAEKNQ